MCPAEYPDRIWLNPPKFWEATKGMSPEEAAQLMERVIALAEVQDYAELSNFEFLSFGNPWRKVA